MTVVYFVTAFAVSDYKAAVWLKNGVYFFGKSGLIGKMRICTVYKGTVKILFGKFIEISLPELYAAVVKFLCRSFKHFVGKVYSV